jgi:hypothetical protein
MQCSSRSPRLLVLGCLRPSNALSTAYVCRWFFSPAGKERIQCQLLNIFAEYINLTSLTMYSLKPRPNRAFLHQLALSEPRPNRALLGMLYLHELILSEPRPNRALLGRLYLHELVLSEPRPNRALLGMLYLHELILSEHPTPPE